MHQQQNALQGTNGRTDIEALPEESFGVFWSLLYCRAHNSDMGLHSLGPVAQNQCDI